MKSSELKTVSLSRIACENLVTLMMMQPPTTMIKSWYFIIFRFSTNHIIVKKLGRNLWVFLLINVRWVDIYCTLTIPLPDVLWKDRQQWKFSMRIDSSERFANSFMYSNTQFYTKNLCIITFGMKKVDLLFLVRLHWRIQNSSCMFSVPMFYTQSADCGPHSTVPFYTDHFLITLVMLVILVFQVLTIFLEITIAPYQCCQSYLKSSKTGSKVAIKISSREQFAIWIITSASHSVNSTETALIRISRIMDKILFKMNNDKLREIAFDDFHKVFYVIDHDLLLKT